MRTQRILFKIKVPATVDEMHLFATKAGNAELTSASTLPPVIAIDIYMKLEYWLFSNSSEALAADFLSAHSVSERICPTLRQSLMNRPKPQHKKTLSRVSCPPATPTPFLHHPKSHRPS